MIPSDTTQHSGTWDEQRPVTASLLILRGLTVGGWVIAEGILLLSVLGVIWSQLGG